MNTFTKTSLYLLLSCLSLLPIRSFSADHVTISLQNATSTSNTLEFDVFIVNDGSTTLKIKGYQFGVNFNLGILNGGTPSATAYTYIPGTRDPSLAALTTATVNYANFQLRTSAGTISSGFPLLPNGVQLCLGRFKFTNTVNWVPGSVANLQLQAQQVVGKTHCVATCYSDSSGLSPDLKFSTGTLSVSASAVSQLTLNIPLPVHISDFTGEKANNEDHLSWTTSQEENNNYFNLQHSIDGINFSTIGQIYSKAERGNSSSAIDYSFNYSSPLTGHNYYRLEQVDIDGHATIETKIVDLVRVSETHEVSLYPNPASHVLNLSWTSDKTHNTIVNILGLNGQLVKTVQSVSFSGTTNLSIDLSQLALGSYLVQVLENNRLAYTGKLLKVN